MIQNISIAKLRPHPNNPRKDLGDLTELADSIKANGVFQNLTVVPNGDDTYTIIIGHRRTAAAKLAGLTELPCAIVEMSEKDQLGTMLLENIQRSELTVYEQAQGFQMMIDLGETVESISDKTGFGKSTIYKRVKLCQLDEEKFKKGQERGATLEDYAKLDKITDPELKNRALDSIGTVNFDNAVRTAVEDERYNATLAKWETILSSFATRTVQVDFNKYHLDETIYMWSEKPDDFVIPKDADEVEYLYTIGVNSYDRERISLYKEYTKSTLEEANEDAERKRKEEERQLRYKKLTELAVSFSNARAEFIRDFTTSKNTEVVQFKAISEFYFQYTNSVSGWYGFEGYSKFERMKDFCRYIGFDFAKYKTRLNKGNNLIEMMAHVPEFADIVQNEPERCMLTLIYLKIENQYTKGHFIDTWDYHNEYKEVSHVEKKYLLLLEALGYQMSDEERSLYDGTHELYMVEEDEEFLDEDDIPDFEEDE